MRLTALLLLALPLAAVAQDKPADDSYAKLRTAWPQVVEAWKTVTAFKAELGKDLEAGKYQFNWAGDAGKLPPFPDSLLRSLGQVSAALDAAGLLGRDVPPELEAFKSGFKARLASVVRLQGASLFGPVKTQQDLQRVQQEYNQASQQLQVEYQAAMNEYNRIMGAGRGVKPAAAAPKSSPAVRLEEAAAALARMKDDNALEDDLVQDAVAKFRESMRDLGILEEQSPAWLRTRVSALLKAVSLGDALPEPAKATPELERRVAELLDLVRGGGIVEREDAAKELAKVGEPCLAKIRAALAGASDEETRVRLRKVLGHRTEKPADEPTEPDAPIRRRIER